MLFIGLGGTVAILLPGGKPVLERATMEELAGLIRYVTHPDRTLITARHGVEWWSAWFLHTRISQPEALRPKDWHSYETILALEVKSGLVSLPGRGGPPPDSGREEGTGDSHLGRLDRETPPKMPSLILPGAEILHDGATLRLARLATAPAGLCFRAFPPP